MTCGGGQRSVTREVIIQPQCGGQYCSGETVTLQQCNTHQCPCVWGSWQAWGGWEVIEARNVKTRTRTRVQEGGEGCDEVETKISETLLPSMTTPVKPEPESRTTVASFLIGIIILLGKYQYLHKCISCIIDYVNFTNMYKVFLILLGLFGCCYYFWKRRTQKSMPVTSEEIETFHKTQVQVEKDNMNQV